MLTPQKIDREIIIDILTLAFENNASVNYIIKQDRSRMTRITLLMRYSFNVCSKYGKVVISEDKKACALVVLKKKTFSIQSLIWNLQLVLGVVGTGNIGKVLKRESLISKQHPADPFYYIWFVGVHPDHKGKGIGSKLLNDLIKDAAAMNLPIYLETSTERNIPWYQRSGFEVFHEVDLGYKLSFLKRELNEINNPKLH